MLSKTVSGRDSGETILDYGTEGASRFLTNLSGKRTEGIIVTEKNKNFLRSVAVRYLVVPNYFTLQSQINGFDFFLLLKMNC